MPRKKIENKNVRKLCRVGKGKTYVVSLPIDAIRSLGWQQKQKVVVEFDVKRKRFIIKDWKK